MGVTSFRDWCGSLRVDLLPRKEWISVFVSIFLFGSVIQRLKTYKEFLIWFVDKIIVGGQSNTYIEYYSIYVFVMPADYYAMLLALVIFRERDDGKKAVALYSVISNWRGALSW